MAVTILLPTALQRYAENKEQLEVSGTTVGEALQSVIAQVPQLAKHLFDAQGQIRTFVNVYLGDDDTRYLQGSATPLKDGDTLTIVPALLAALERKITGVNSRTRAAAASRRAYATAGGLYNALPAARRSVVKLFRFSRRAHANGEAALQSPRRSKAIAHLPCLRHRYDDCA